MLHNVLFKYLALSFVGGRGNVLFKYLALSFVGKRGVKYVFHGGRVKNAIVAHLQLN